MDSINTPDAKDARESIQSPVNPEILEIIADCGQFLVVGLLLDLLLFEGTEVVAVIRLAAIAALLVGVLKSHGWLVLLALQFSLFLREPRRPEMLLGFVPPLYGMMSICVIAYAYLGKPLRSRVSKCLTSRVLFALGIEEQTASEASEPNDRDANWIQLVAVQLSIWFAITIVAMLTLLRLPISPSVRSEWLRDAIENDFTVWPGATLLVLTVLLVIVFREAGWRQMSRAQASLYLRSSFVLDHYHDLRMIVLRRLKRAKMQTDASATQKQLVERSVDAPLNPK